MRGQYPIGTLEGMAAIPEEALPRFLAELPTILAEARRAYEAMADFAAAFPDEIKAIETSPVWVDDDADTFSCSVGIAGEDDKIATATVKRGR